MDEGLFEARVSGDWQRYHYEAVTRDGRHVSFADPYAFRSILTDYDLYLLGEGCHLYTYDKLGAHLDTIDGVVGVRFGVWAPNAQKVDVVFGDPASGYIADDGTGITTKHHAVALTKVAGGIWGGAPQGSFESFKSHPYMYRIKNAQGQTVYRTDIFSRSRHVFELSISFIDE